MGMVTGHKGPSRRRGPLLYVATHKTIVAINSNWIHLKGSETTNYQKLCIVQVQVHVHCTCGCYSAISIAKYHAFLLVQYLHSVA